MSLQEILLENTIKGISLLYGIAMENVEIQQTRKEFEGDYQRFPSSDCGIFVPQYEQAPTLRTYP